MQKQRRVRVFVQRVLKRAGEASKSSVTRLFAVDLLDGTTTVLAKDSTKTVDVSHTGRTITCLTDAEVPAGTVLLEEKFTGELYRPKAVEYNLYVFDGTDLHFIDFPSEYSTSSLKVVHNNITLYFCTSEVNADVTVKRMPVKNGYTVHVHHRSGSDYEFVYGDQTDATHEEAKVVAAKIASTGGSIVRHITWEE
jgi:hypothetical protein